MAATESRRALTLLFLCFIPASFAQDYSIPDVTIQALKPSGIRISIPVEPKLVLQPKLNLRVDPWGPLLIWIVPDMTQNILRIRVKQDNPRMSLFAFQGNINREIDDNDVGTISAEAMAPQNGFWTVQDDEVELKPGDIINYYVHVIRNRKGYHKDRLSYTVKELIDPNASSLTPATQSPATSGTGPSAPPTAPAGCQPTVTVVRNGPVCSGQVIFEENFDSLREDRWNIEQYIPQRPEFPFISYQRPPNGPTVFIENGVLRIQPKLQRISSDAEGDEIAFNVKLDLSQGCTRPGLCVSDVIDPSIASGRITSSAFVFKYGLIEVRAKLPQGDWIYPDILLEPLMEKYGPHYASGVLRIAGARGNMELTKGIEDYGNKVLYGGPIMDFECRDKLIVKKATTSAWGNEFHVYSLRWAPDRIILAVDGEEWGRIEPATSGLHAHLPKDKCNPPRMFLKTPMAPFDEFFRITLGVAVGGISEFPDLSITQNSKPKPWTDKQSKARKNFFEDKNSWLPTWSQPALLVDYVKVRAL